MEEFLKKVLNGFELCNVSFEKKLTLACAVSGGADSIALLTATKEILPPYFILKVITVNHNMRSKEETEGDDDQDRIIYSYQNAFHGVAARLSEEEAEIAPQNANCNPKEKS